MNGCASMHTRLRKLSRLTILASYHLMHRLIVSLLVGSCLAFDSDFDSDGFRLTWYGSTPITSFDSAQSLTINVSI